MVNAPVLMVVLTVMPFSAHLGPLAPSSLSKLPLAALGRNKLLGPWSEPSLGVRKGWTQVTLGKGQG